MAVRRTSGSPTDFSLGSLAMKWFSNLFMPFLDWIQVEVTSHCNAECVYCPHSVYKQSWQNSHIAVETFEKLLPAFRRTRLVYLQGWGEPILHPRFFEMVRIARECGCQVGTTTNGMLCTGELPERLVREGLSIVGFSLAGTDESQDAIRRGTRLQGVLEAIRQVNLAKKRLGSSLPDIHVAYIWLRSQLQAVKQLPSLLEGTGVRQVVASTLDFVPHQDLAAEALYAQDEEEESFLRGIISEVVEDGRKRGLDIHCRLVTRHRPPGICTENVARALVVSSQGLVCPCVFGNLPIIESQEPADLGSTSAKSPTFGDIKGQSLSSIWRRKDYRAFRQNHANGRGTDSCGDCPKLFCSE
jgi:MoaA/NifB/PqqE/SkfB family radical SAM enzyme